MLSKFFARFKRKLPESEYENLVCQNCETEFSGHFCPQCGQAVKEYDKPFSFIFYNFVGDFFAFDTRFFRTLFSLLFKPGFLTKQYFAGKRVRYAPPFRIFIFVSFILFLLLQTYTNRGLTTVLDTDFKDKIKLDSTAVSVADSVMSDLSEEMSPEDKAITDSLLTQYGVKKDTAKLEDLDFKLNLESFRDTRDLRKSLDLYASSLEQDLEEETDPEERAKIREYIRLCRSPESAVAKILKYISYAFFILLPLLALLLKVVYIRRKQNYVRHLVFSIHVHSFIYLLMIFVVGMYLAIDANLEWLTTITVFLIPAYLIIAMKKFYGQRTRKVILKFFVVSFLYNISFFIIFILAIMNAINMI